MDGKIFELALTKLGPILGPAVVAALLGGFIAWNGRGLIADNQNAIAKVTQLESAMVRKDSFAVVIRDVIQRLDAVQAKQDATNTLLNRVICQKQTIVLCSR